MVYLHYFLAAVCAISTTICTAKKIYTPGDKIDVASMPSYSSITGSFSLDLYKKTAKTTDNFAISPLSIHAALSMLMLGTAYKANSELRHGLHYGSKIDRNGFKEYNSSLEQGNNPNVTVKVANALYMKQGQRVMPFFVDKLKYYYNINIGRFSRKNPHVPINQWVADQTDNKITDFLSSSDITKDTLLMLLNTVYFKAKWETQFDSTATKLKSFTDENNKIYETEMMYIGGGKFQFVTSRDLKAAVLRLPYMGNRFSLNIILPYKRQTLSAVESRLTNKIFSNILTSLKDQVTKYIDVLLPKFTLDTTASMKDTLKSLGIKEIFSPGRGKFFKIINDPRLCVDKVKHRCVFDVSEEGTEAAAVTSVSLDIRMLSKRFYANRPFMFVLRDDVKRINLFVGRYTNPKGGNLSA